MQNISGEIADCIVLGAYYIKAGNSVIDLGITVLILSLHSSRKKGTGKKKKIMSGILFPLVKKA